MIARVLAPSDPFCPKCGHNRDNSSVSSIDEGGGRKSCQLCGTEWSEPDQGARMSEIELPEPAGRLTQCPDGWSNHGAAGYTAEQVRQLIAAERERCAKLCEVMEYRCPQCAAHNDHDQCEHPAGADYAAAIRRG